MRKQPPLVVRFFPKKEKLWGGNYIFFSVASGSFLHLEISQGNIQHYEMWLFQARQMENKQRWKQKHEQTARGVPPTPSPFQMATHEQQCVMVWWRHVEHQTLQTIHFVHVVWHLCNKEQRTCHISNKYHHLHSIICTLLPLENWLTSANRYHMHPPSNLMQKRAVIGYHHRGLMNSIWTDCHAKKSHGLIRNVEFRTKRKLTFPFIISY